MNKSDYVLGILYLILYCTVFPIKTMYNVEPINMITHNTIIILSIILSIILYIFIIY